ncbi:MAG: hypothetical protein ACO3JL_15300, partial [Myxococcota bacterium]
RSLGRLLPHQLANQTRALPLSAGKKAQKGGGKSKKPSKGIKGKKAETKKAHKSENKSRSPASLPWMFGSRDQRADQNYQANLKGASARVREQPGKRSVSLSPKEIEKIRAAPNQEAAKKLALEALTGKKGTQESRLGNLGFLTGAASNNTQAVNKLLGTHLGWGPRKNERAGDLLERMACSVAETVRSSEGKHKARNVNEFSGAGGAAEDCGPTKGPTHLDLSEFLCAAKSIAELTSPLIFDLIGAGLELREGERIALDLDGDGREELITDLDDGIGLLVFAPGQDDEDGGSARAFFGDRTDLSAYGVDAPQHDGFWEHGFAALRALCERYDLVHGDKQHLDAADLRLLEDEVGLRMRVGGLLGEDRRFAELGITRINLGAPERTDRIEHAAVDRFGNRLMTQDGATFVIDEQTRPYADIWFAVWSRAELADEHRGRESAVDAGA